MVLVSRPAANTKFVRKEERQDVGQMTAPGKKVKGLDRYRAGKRRDEEGESDDELVMRGEKKVEVKVEEKVGDRRLQRIQQQGGRRRVMEAEVIEEAAVEAVDDEEDDFDARRERAKMLRAPSPEGEISLGGDEEEEYEEVTESESEEGMGVVLAKPVFVAKHERVTQLERRKEEVEQHELMVRKKSVDEKRRADTTRMVIEEKKREQAANDAESDGELPDDDDDVEIELEKEKWKLRALQRMQRYKEERQKEEMEKLEIERRRNLSDDARKQENIDYDKKLVSLGLSTDKVKRNFMQKHYHKGGFFQDTAEKGMQKDEIYRRDIDHAVGSDKFNKEVLPQVMQVRGDEFGKRGQTKWTHLTNEDTTYQKDRQGNVMENSFITTTFASNKATMSANQAHQASENHLMFRHEKVKDTTPLAPGLARLGATREGHKDAQLSRPSKKRQAR